MALCAPRANQVPGAVHYRVKDRSVARRTNSFEFQFFPATWHRAPRRGDLIAPQNA